MDKHSRNGYLKVLRERYLKAKIRKEKTKIRLERDRAERRQQKEVAAAERKELQPALFEF